MTSGDDPRPGSAPFRHPDRRSLLAGLVALATFPGSARAQAYPDRVVTIVSPFAAGGTNDLVARLSAEALSAALGQQFIVQNVVGAGGNIGAAQVARAAPDGYTLLTGAGAMAINQTLYRSISFDVLKDFEPISVVAMVPNLLAVRPSLGANSVPELVAMAKKNPRGLNYGSPGVGSVGHLATEMFCARAGIQMTHVPFRGSSPAVTALLGGQIDMMLDNLPPLAPHAESGSLRGLAVASAQRLKAFPSIPTIAESGYPGFEATAWQSLLAPARAPKPIVEKIAATIRDAIQRPEVRAKFENAGAEPFGNSPAEFRDFLRAEVTKWAEVIKTSGARLD